jgi:hypothetical protein
MPALPLNKLYIDSAFKTSDSISDSQFKFELPHSVDFPANTYFIIDDVCIPHSWYSIETGMNDTLYFNLIFNASGTVSGAQITIAAGNYAGISLQTAIQNALPYAITATGASSIVNLSLVLSTSFSPTYYYDILHRP